MIKKFDTAEVIRGGNLQQVEYGLCYKGLRHHKIILINNEHGSFSIVNEPYPCDRMSCANGTKVNLHELPLVVARQLIEVVPKEHILIETNKLESSQDPFSDRSWVHSAGSLVPALTYKEALVLGPNQDPYEYYLSALVSRKLVKLIVKNEGGEPVVSKSSPVAEYMAKIPLNVEETAAKKIRHTAGTPDNLREAIRWIEKVMSIEKERHPDTQGAIDKVDSILKGRGGKMDFKMARQNKLFKSEQWPAIKASSFRNNFEPILKTAHLILLARRW